jgi:Spy/CpxP family protein refolding chaperone
LGNSLKWGGITLAVIAGLLLGFAITTTAYRYHLLRVPGPHGFVDRLNKDLQLTPDQLHQIEVLMRDSHTKMDQLHDDFRRQHDQIIYQTHDQIRALLTTEQQQKFDRDFSHPPVGEGPREHQYHDHGN